VRYCDWARGAEDGGNLEGASLYNRKLIERRTSIIIYIVKARLTLEYPGNSIRSRTPFLCASSAGGG
jgi:hypothetical protein